MNLRNEKVLNSVAATTMQNEHCLGPSYATRFMMKVRIPACTIERKV